jgi:hypothetical protein
MEAEASGYAAGEGLAGTAEAEAEHAPDEAPSAEIAGAEVQHAAGDWEVVHRSGTKKEMQPVGRMTEANFPNKSPPGRSTVASLRSIAGHQRVPKHLRGRTSLITLAGDDFKDREVDTRNLDVSLLEKIAACPDEGHSDEGDGEADGIAGRVPDEATAPDRHTGTAAVLDRRQEATDGLEGGGKDGEAAGKSAADFVYSGERDDDGLPHGFGRCVYSQTGLVYEGEFEHGSACGDGKLTWPNGSVYLGVVLAGQPVEGRLDRANGETLYFVDGEVQDSEWYALEDREVTQEELDAAKQEAEAARLDVLKARLIAEEMHASIELKEAEQEVENLAREVKLARTKVQRERRLRTTQAAMRGLRLKILCTKEEPVRPVSDTGGRGEEEAGRVTKEEAGRFTTTVAARSASPSSRPQTRSTAAQGGDGGADVEAEAEAEAHTLERKRAGIVMEIRVAEFRVDWRLEHLDLTWFQALDQNIRQAFKLPLPKYDSFGFPEKEPEPPGSPHTLAVHQRSKELLAFSIGPELLSDSESDIEEELDILALPRELPFTPHLLLQGALQRYLDGLLLLCLLVCYKCTSTHTHTRGTWIGCCCCVCLCVIYTSTHAHEVHGWAAAGCKEQTQAR